MKIIVGITGASGVLGKYFVNKYKNYQYDFFQGDITNKKDVDKWIKSTESKYIIHLASKVSTEYVKNNFQKALSVNYSGTKYLVDKIIKSKKKIWFFFASSSHVYKISNKKLKENDLLRPLTHYGKSKFKTERYLLNKLKKNNLKICIGRIFSFTHSSQKIPYLIPSLFKKINSKKREITLKNLNHERDFCHIDDICRGINLLMKQNSTGVFNIASGKKIKLYDLVKIINSRGKKIIYLENNIRTKLVANITKIKRVGFKPRFGINKIITDFGAK